VNRAYRVSEGRAAERGDTTPNLPIECSRTPKATAMLRNRIDTLTKLVLPNLAGWRRPCLSGLRPDTLTLDGAQRKLCELNNGSANRRFCGSGWLAQALLFRPAFVRRIRMPQARPTTLAQAIHFKNRSVGEIVESPT
jgi:hypothetical protein